MRARQKVKKKETGDPARKACLWDAKGNILGVEVVHTPESAKAALEEKAKREGGLKDTSWETLPHRLLANVYGREVVTPAPPADEPAALAVAPMAGAPQEPDPDPGKITVRAALERIEPWNYKHVFEWKHLPADIQEAFQYWMKAKRSLGDPYNDAIALRIMLLPDASWCLVIEGSAEPVVEWARDYGGFPDANGVGQIVRLRNVRRADIKAAGGLTKTHLTMLIDEDLAMPWGIRLNITDDPKAERVLFRFAAKEEAEASAKLVGGGAFPKARAMKRSIDR
jgi:hypothetical protein